MVYAVPSQRGLEFDDEALLRREAHITSLLTPHGRPLGGEPR